MTDGSHISYSKSVILLYPGLLSRVSLLALSMVFPVPFNFCLLFIFSFFFDLSSPSIHSYLIAYGPCFIGSSDFLVFSPLIRSHSHRFMTTPFF